MEKKLSLSQLKVESFITSLNRKESCFVKGGTYPTNNGCQTNGQCHTQVNCTADPTNTDTLYSQTGCDPETDGGEEEV